ncbi:hypothetical protein Q4595_25330, partial [Wenyingzhuangia sp. 1_MG-2023]|nr:hypothetical protein [Wenyingzhuangia sp. 1_MG-2023]
ITGIAVSITQPLGRSWARLVLWPDNGILYLNPRFKPSDTYQETLSKKPQPYNNSKAQNNFKL